MTVFAEATMTTQRFELRVFDGQYQVLHGQRHTITLDLDSNAVDGILDNRLTALIRQARAMGEPMDAPRLEVWLDNFKVMDWAG